MKWYLWRKGRSSLSGSSTQKQIADQIFDHALLLRLS